jgi:hypothetical protein
VVEELASPVVGLIKISRSAPQTNVRQNLQNEINMEQRAVARAIFFGKRTAWDKKP